MGLLNILCLDFYFTVAQAIQVRPSSLLPLESLKRKCISRRAQTCGALFKLLGCTGLILVFASPTYSRKIVIYHGRQKEALFHLVNQTVPLLVSLGAQYLWESWCSGYSPKMFIVVTCWDFVSVGTCMPMCMNTCMAVQACA